jgi:2-polyprenyl-3-methyl-5-hydroxy-6-metoxy-1,4-benzoquinol methylase
LKDAEPDLSQQIRFWNDWNTHAREFSLEEVSLRQAEVVTRWLVAMERHDLRILDVGCGAGWLSASLLPYGSVTGIDLADEIIERARIRYPEVTFVSGDFMQLAFDREVFDVVVALEVLSHVADQTAFLARLAALLRPGGQLMLATQNRPVLQRFNRIPPPGPGQLRHWVDKKELRHLLPPEFKVLELFSVTPIGDRGLMRLVNSRKADAAMRALLGDRVDRVKEQVGLGWTLMCRAERE